MKKLLNLQTLIEMAEKLKSQGKKIAATSGCFDILHAGHVTYLAEAKGKADILVVMLNSDSSVRSLKGIERPIVPQDERARVISAIESVDFVCIFDDDTPCNAYAAFKPDVVVKGGDYEGTHIPEMDTVAEYGGTVEYVSLVGGCSSTNIIECIKNLVKGD